MFPLFNSEKIEYRIKPVHIKKFLDSLINRGHQDNSISIIFEVFTHCYDVTDQEKNFISDHSVIIILHREISQSNR